jgi:hypothetical protein
MFKCSTKDAMAEPPSVPGGPVVVEFAPPPPKPKKKPRARLEPEQQIAKQDLLTAKEFVDKYRREVVTASWDPAVLRKCGRKAEQILMTLGATQHKESVPMREQARRRQLHIDQAELEGTTNPDHLRPKRKKK